MLPTLQRLALTACLGLSVIACASEQNASSNEHSIYQTNRFIVQLTQRASKELEGNSQRKDKLLQWEQATGVRLKAVPPTNSRRWVIETDTKELGQIRTLISTIRQDRAVKYIEEDSIMTIMPSQPTPSSRPSAQQY